MFDSAQAGKQKVAGIKSFISITCLPHSRIRKCKSRAHATCVCGPVLHPCHSHHKNKVDPIPCGAWSWAASPRGCCLLSQIAPQRAESTSTVADPWKFRVGVCVEGVSGPSSQPFPPRSKPGVRMFRVGNGTPGKLTDRKAPQPRAWNPPKPSYYSSTTMGYRFRILMTGQPPNQVTQKMGHRLLAEGSDRFQT